MYQNELLDINTRSKKSSGKIKVLKISHFRLATVLNANRIVFIEKGEVVEEGTHEELLNLRGHYYQLVLENEPSIAPSENTDNTTNRKY